MFIIAAPVCTGLFPYSGVAVAGRFQEEHSHLHRGDGGGGLQQAALSNLRRKDHHLQHHNCEYFYFRVSRQVEGPGSERGKQLHTSRVETPSESMSYRIFKENNLTTAL